MHAKICCYDAIYCIGGTAEQPLEKGVMGMKNRITKLVLLFSLFNVYTGVDTVAQLF